jgi:hypothetical protein
MQYSLYFMNSFKGKANVEKRVTILYSLFPERISQICRRHESKYFLLFILHAENAVYLQHKYKKEFLAAQYAQKLFFEKSCFLSSR